MNSLFKLFKKQIMREILIQKRQIRLIINTCLFFLMITVLFPMTMPPEVALLRTVAPGLVWIALLLALFLSSERIFQQDYEDGVIEQWFISGYPISLFVMAKTVVHWFLNIMPMVIFCLLLALLFSLNGHEVSVLMLSLCCGSPAIFWLCVLAAAFGTGLDQKGILMALVLIPLTIPVMIFGSSTLIAAMQGQPIEGYFALLLAMSFTSTALLPFAIASVLRVRLVY